MTEAEKKLANELWQYQSIRQAVYDSVSITETANNVAVAIDRLPVSLSNSITLVIMQHRWEESNKLNVCTDLLIKATDRR